MYSLKKMVRLSRENLKSELFRSTKATMNGNRNDCYIVKQSPYPYG